LGGGIGSIAVASRRDALPARDVGSRLATKNTNSIENSGWKRCKDDQKIDRLVDMGAIFA
jgi:hypothetical protein